MKNSIYILLIMILMFSVAAYGQPVIVDIPSDAGGSEGAINAAVDAAITGGTLSNTIFKLEPFGYYILSGTVNVPVGEHLTIVADEPGTTPETGPPQIFLSSQVTSWRYNFDVYGDITLKNLTLMYCNISGAQQSASLDIDEDTLRHRNVAEFEGVIFDYAPVNGAIEVRCTHLVADFKKCYWRNNIDPHYRYYGRAVSYPYQSDTWHTDSISFENCTFANLGYVYMGYAPGEDTPEYADYVKFNHCTFLNTMMYSLEPSYHQQLSVTNCIFQNIFMYGDIPSGRGGITGNPNGGTINIDSLSGADITFPIGEQDRHILFTHSSYYIEQWIRDYMDHGNHYSDTAGPESKPLPQPMMSTKTLRFFDSIDVASSQPFPFNKGWPYINRSNLYDNADPGFFLTPTNQQGIMDFLIGRWETGANVDWSYNFTSDYNGTWPLEENLQYMDAVSVTGSKLDTAGMRGYPLGDLYHWWPSQYTAWQAQAAQENQRISIWLASGVDPGPDVNVIERPGVPKKFELGQNYPNPFNPATRIDYSVPDNGYVSLKVYNLIGEEVATLFSGVQRAGNYTANFDGSRLASGVYFYRLKTQNASMTKKLVLVK